MSEKLIPHTANSLNVGLTDKPGNSEYIAMSQKGVTELLSGENPSLAVFEDAPKDGKFNARKDGAWVAVNVTALA